MPFKILFKKPPPSPGDEIFSMSSVSTTADTAKDYRAFQVTVEAVDSQDDPGNPGAFVIRGQVANQGSKDVARIKMTFVGYDSTGKVIAAWNGPGPDGLKAGSSGAFGFAVLDSQGTPTNYAMIVTGS